MGLNSTDLDGGIRKITIAGRLDLEGVESIDLKFTALASTRQNSVIVDMSEVTFLASIGIAMLIRNARSLRLRKGSMVLLSPQPPVERVSISRRIEPLLPICQTLEEACTLLTSPPPSPPV